MSSKKPIFTPAVSRFCLVYLLEVTFSAGANNHAAGTSALLNFMNLINPQTGARETKSVSVTVGASAMGGPAVADAWAAAINAALSSYGVIAARGYGGYANVVVSVPYSAELPVVYVSPAHTGMFMSLANMITVNPVLEKALTDYSTQISDATTTITDLDNQVQILKVQAAAGGSEGAASPGSTSVVVSTPENKGQTIIAAMAGFSAGFMIGDKKSRRK